MRRSSAETISMYLFTTFEQRLQSVIEFLDTKPDNSDRHIAEELHVSEELVRRQRKFIGIEPYTPKPPEPEPEPITDPDDYFVPKKRQRKVYKRRIRRKGAYKKADPKTDKRRGRGPSRTDVYDNADKVKALRDTGMSIRDIADIFGCSPTPIQNILGE